MIHSKISSFGNSAGGSRRKADLGDPSKWSLGDLSHFGRVLLQYEADLEELEAYRDEQERAKRELHSGMLKGEVSRLHLASMAMLMVFL
jgi:nucleoporin NUP159